MDRFLEGQSEGELIDVRNEFTVDRGRSRKKLLESIPRGSEQSLDSIFRMFDAAVGRFGASPGEAMSYWQGSDNSPESLTLSLPHAPRAQVSALLDELRRPFSQHLDTNIMAKAIFRSVGQGARVQISWVSFTSLLADGRRLTLKPGYLRVPENLVEPDKQGVRIEIFGLEGVEDYRRHRKTVQRKVLPSFSQPERLLPLESLSGEVSGYFDYRARPFTLIRSYATAPSDWVEDKLHLDLWPGPYERLTDQTFVLERQKAGKFLFMRWRPDYGRPTLLHHNLQSPLDFGEQACRATFWVETAERSPVVHLCSDGVFCDPVQLEGPTGLTGIVVWPGLTRDIWGSRLVKNDCYEEALEWTQSQITATAICLKENLEDVLERVQDSNLLKKSYVSETIARMREFWA